jgi:ribonucleoside-diphosphate reductase alpha chain
MQAKGYDTGLEIKAPERGACPECGGVVEHEGGCMVCRVCAYSECN